MALFSAILAIFKFLAIMATPHLKICLRCSNTFFACKLSFIYIFMEILEVLRQFLRKMADLGQLMVRFIHSDMVLDENIFKITKIGQI